MKVTQLTTSLGGGAGKAVLRIQEGLLDQAVQSSILSLNEYPQAEHIYTYASLLSNKELFLTEQKNLLFKIKKVFQKSGISIHSTYFSLMETAYKKVHQLSLIKEADILHLHWVANFIDLTSFLKKTNQPIVWTLHDWNPFTAGYHYSPTEEELKVNQKVLNKLLQQKRRAYQNKNIHFAYTSKNMGAILKATDIGKDFPAHHVPLGLDTQVFQPRNKTYSRELLNIPTDKKVVLVVADDLKATRKGFKYVIEASKLLGDEKDLLFCVLGNCDLSLFPKDFPVQYLGFFKDELLMSMAYSAADLFITTSIQEAFGQTIIESLCCGTPVIGFPFGVMEEAVKDNENGFVCSTINSENLAKKIQQALQKDWNRTKIRTNAANQYNLKVQAANYANLYQKLV